MSLPPVILGFSGIKNYGNSSKAKGLDTIFVQKSTNEWSLIVSVNEERKLTVSATRNIGKINSGWNDGEQASIQIQLQTINGRIPDFVKTNEYYNQATASSTEKGYVEIDDKQNKVTESFKPELEYYERKFPGSSILEINEFLLSLVPDFESLLKDQKLDEYVGNIINEAGNVHKHKKEYIKPKHQVSNSKPTETVSITEHEKLKATVQALTGVNESPRERINDLSKPETEAGTGLYQ